MKLPFQIDLTGKVVVVTGAGGVICSVLAEAMAMTGAKVALLDLNEDAAKKHADDITAKGYIAKGYKCNVLEKASVQAARDQIAADFGTCDILINGAGGNNPKATTDDEYFVPEDLGQMKTFFDLDADGVSFVFSLNFMGTLIPTQVFALDMVNKKGASIINISSMNAYTPLTKIPAYSGAKAAISNFTEWLAVHFAPCGERAKIVIPSDSSSSFIARLRFGCPIYRFSAARLIDFVFATSTAYLRYSMFMLSPCPESAKESYLRFQPVFVSIHTIITFLLRFCKAGA